MLNQYEELAVLEQGDDGAIVAIHGQGRPSVLLGADYLSHLDRVVSVAISSTFNGAPLHPSVQLLCSEIQTLLGTYEDTCNKFHGCGAPTTARSTADALHELDGMRRQLDALR